MPDNKRDILGAGLAQKATQLADGSYTEIRVGIMNLREINALSSAAGKLFFTILTHPELEPGGILKDTEEGLCRDLAVSFKPCPIEVALCEVAEVDYDPEERFRVAFQELLRKGLIAYDPQYPLISILNFKRYARRIVRKYLKAEEAQKGQR